MDKATYDPNGQCTEPQFKKLCVEHRRTGQNWPKNEWKTKTGAEVSAKIDELVDLPDAQPKQQGEKPQAKNHPAERKENQTSDIEAGMVTKKMWDWYISANRGLVPETEAAKKRMDDEFLYLLARLRRNKALAREVTE